MVDLPRDVDAIVVGSGPNGLVAANLLADAGWEVLVLEAQPEPGGAVRTVEVTAPGVRNDLYSAFYPLAAASPVVAGLHLEDHGLRWSHAPLVLGHPTPGGPTAVLSRSVAETAESLDCFAPGDGTRWEELMDELSDAFEPFLGALLTPFPPVRHGARLVGRLGPRGTLDFARTALLPVRTLWEERFEGEGAGLLLAGLALHADLTTEAAGSGLFALVLAVLGQTVGFPVPEGGADGFTQALVHRLESKGGQVVCDCPVTSIRVNGGRATAVDTRDGHRVGAGRAVLADVLATSLFGGLVAWQHLPPRLAAAMGRFEPGPGTVKVDWSTGGPIPWTDPVLGRAGTVHLGDSLDQVTTAATELAMHRRPTHDVLVLGQMTVADPTRSPAGTSSVWAYCHVPQPTGADEWDAADTERFVARLEERVEAHAPGFRDTVTGRHVLTPANFADHDANLVGGAINGGTAQLHQQGPFRPPGGWGRAETPIRGLYLASASAHPGGGVHGAPGSNAARAALFHDRARRARPLAVATGAAVVAVGLASRAASHRS